MRATIRNLKDRDFTQGASTLSMQLARNCFKMRQKSLHRKFLEIALTLRLESRYSKDEILTHYLNRIYFGAGADGIEQAARTYFGKTTHDLSEGECAMIVGIIRGPHIFSPFRNLDAAVEQRNQTLNRLIAMKLIDEARRDRILAEPIRLVKEDQRETQTSYALQAVRRELDRVMETDEIQLGGLHVYTTIDAGTEPDYIQYAAVTTDIKTGATLALIGGRNYSDSRFDRTRSSRDLGSAFEPFVAAAAAELG